jgi:hypothetical protein
MAVQYDIKNPTNRILLRNNIKNHYREQEFLILLDAEEKERRDSFIHNINLMLDDGIFPFKTIYDWYFSKSCFYPWWGLPNYNYDDIGPNKYLVFINKNEYQLMKPYFLEPAFKQEQRRWLEDVLKQRGWIKLQNGNYKPTPDWINKSLHYLEKGLPKSEDEILKRLTLREIRKLIWNLNNYKSLRKIRS